MTIETVLNGILVERRRQQEREGWTIEHDDEHDGGELCAAGAAYAINAANVLSPCQQGDADGAQPDCWPWEAADWKPKEPRRDLIRAAALIVAEIERLDRLSARAASGGRA